MAAAENRSGDSAPERPSPESPTRRLRALSQADFELEFFGAILERDPCYTAVLRVQAEILAARGLHARTLQIDRRLVRLLPDRPIPWYNLACSYAVLGMTDPALTALQRALELRYPRPDLLTRDPDLTSLHQDHRFLRLLARLRFTHQG